MKSYSNEQGGWFVKSESAPNTMSDPAQSAVLLTHKLNFDFANENALEPTTN